MKSILRNVFRLSAFVAVCLAVLPCVSAAGYNWRTDGTASAFTDGPSWTPAWVTGSAPWAAGDTANFLSGTNQVTGNVFLKGDTKMNGVHLIAQSGSLTTATGAMELRGADTKFSVLSGATFTLGGSMYVDGGIVLDGGTLTQTTGEFRVCFDGNRPEQTYTGVVELKNGATLNAFNLRLNQTDGNGKEIKLMIAGSTTNLSGAEFLVGGSKGVATVTQSGDSVVNISGATNFKITADAAASGSAYHLEGGTLNYGTDGLTMGVFSMATASTGRFIHTGGTFNFGTETATREMWIRHAATQNTDVSTYAISGASSVLNLHGNLQISNGALFSIADGARVDVDGNVRVGTAGNWGSDFVMTGGVLNINGGAFIVGDSSAGKFNQSGDSTVTVSENTNFYIGNSTAANGASYTISGGELNINAKNFVIGNATGDAANNTGLFYQSGDSTVSISGATNFRIGADDAARGSAYYLQGGTLNYGTDGKTGGTFLFSDAGSTNGLFEHTGGTFNFGTADNKRDMWLRNSQSNNLKDGNRYLISGSSSVLNLHGNLRVSGGAMFSLTDSASVYVSDEVRMGVDGNYRVSFTMDGEDSQLEANAIRLSRNTQFTQRNGDILIHGDLILGTVLETVNVGTGTPVDAIYDMSGGSITIDNAAGNFIIGNSDLSAGHSSIFTMNGGEILFKGNQFMMGAETAAKNSGKGSTFNLNGGTFTYQGSGDVLLGVEANRNVKFNHAAGTFDAQDNAIKLNSGATYTLSGADAELKAATVDTSGGGTFTFTNGTAEIDTFFGDLNQQGGTLRGITSIDGDYTQAAGATLDLVLANPGDLLNITGDATLDGLMNIILSGDFIAGMGTDPVSIIDANNFVSFSENFSVFAPGNYTVGWDMSAGLVTLQQDGSHATPEPATWVMLLAAFAMLGVMRRRGKAVVK